MRRKIKVLDRIEQKMTQVQEGSLRHSILVCAKRFKSSWIELGRYLMNVHRDKSFKQWGYLTFEAYCMKEIGIRKATGVKLLRSYYFLEQEEPDFIKRTHLDSIQTKQIPSFEAVHTLRQARHNRLLDRSDYEKIRNNVLVEGKPEAQVKDVYQTMLKAIRESEPEEARRQRRRKYIRQMIGTLRSLKRENEINNFFSAVIIKDIDKIIGKIEKELV